jgi:hypothetical protein
VVEIQPVRIPGRWRDGRALDVHTVSSTYVGDDEFGHARFDYDDRWRLLDGLHEVDRRTVEGRRILLFDDLFRSGATMNAVTSALYDQRLARDVYALALTRTRSRL